MTPEVEHDLTPASSTPGRAIRGTFSIEIEMPRFARSSFHRTGREVLTYSPAEKQFVMRDRPHRGLTQKAVAGFSLDEAPHLFYAIPMLGLNEIVVGQQLKFVNEYDEWAVLWERFDGAEAAIIRRAWMTPESPNPTVSRAGERIVFQGDASRWRIERGGAR
jgi:hypothetical protein